MPAHDPSRSLYSACPTWLDLDSFAEQIGPLLEHPLLPAGHRAALTYVRDEMDALEDTAEKETLLCGAALRIGRWTGEWLALMTPPEDRMERLLDRVRVVYGDQCTGGNNRFVAGNYLGLGTSLGLGEVVAHQDGDDLDELLKPLMEPILIGRHHFLEVLFHLTNRDEIRTRSRESVYRATMSLKGAAALASEGLRPPMPEPEASLSVIRSRRREFLEQVRKFGNEDPDGPSTTMSFMLAGLLPSDMYFCTRAARL